MENVQSIVQKYKNKIFDEKIFFSPDIPKKKLKNAIKTYANIVDNEIPLILIDDTVFGSAKAGILLTNYRIYIKDSDSKNSFSCLIEDIEQVSFKNYIIMKRLTINETLKIDFTQPDKKSLSLFSDMLLELSGIQIEETFSWSNIGIGVGVGALFGGPIGAAIGAAIGASLENKNATKIASKKEESSKIIFIVTLASIMAKMAKIDGVITEDEADTIIELFDELDFENEERILAKNAFENAKDDNFSIYEYATQYKEIADNDLREFLYSTLWLIALSDGYIHTKEDEILREIPVYLGLNKNKYHEYLNEFNNNEDENESDEDLSLSECYTILGCEPNDSMKIVKKNYLKLVAEYHPDKIQSKGLPDSFINFATEQMQKINFAYDTVKNSKM